MNIVTPQKNASYRNEFCVYIKTTMMGKDEIETITFFHEIS